MAQPLRVAVLIDGENASAKSGAVVLRELSRLDPNAVRRIYANFNRQNLKTWESVITHFQLTKKPNCAHPKGKNVSDMHLAVEAMDLLHAGNVDAFWILSSDSDFTQLARRLREGGKTVIGFGKSHTPNSYREACCEFVVVEQPPLAHMTTRMLQAFEHTKDEAGWAFLAAMGQWLKERNIKFDTKTLGCSRTIKLVQKTNMFLVDRADRFGPTRVRLKIADQLPS